MTQEELNKVIERHQHWLKEDCEGWEEMRADLSRADLRGANFSGANLSRANLSRANLSRADFSGANLRGADLRGANFSGANLSRANLRGADFSGADLRGAYFSGADFSGANFSGADLDEKERYRLGQIINEPLTGYKITDEGVVITAEIPAGAIVFSINGKKCRTNRAKITDIGEDKDAVLHSQYDNEFTYTLGKEIVIEDFNLMYNVECASGFHFFRTREEAENY